MTKADAQIVASDLINAGYLVSLRIDPVNVYVVIAKPVTNGNIVAGTTAQAFAVSHGVSLFLREAEFS